MPEQLTRHVPIEPGSFDPQARTFELRLAPLPRQGESVERLAAYQDWPSSVPFLGTRRNGGLLGRVTGFGARGGDAIAVVKLASNRGLDGLADDIGDGTVSALALRFAVDRWSHAFVERARFRLTLRERKWNMAVMPFDDPRDDILFCIRMGLMHCMGQPEARTQRARSHRQG